MDHHGLQLLNSSPVSWAQRSAIPTPARGLSLVSTAKLGDQALLLGQGGEAAPRPRRRWLDRLAKNHASSRIPAGHATAVALHVTSPPQPLRGNFRRSYSFATETSLALCLLLTAGASAGRHSETAVWF